MNVHSAQPENKYPNVEGGFSENNRRDARYQCTHTHIRPHGGLFSNNGKIFYLLIFHKSAEVEKVQLKGCTQSDIVGIKMKKVCAGGTTNKKK